MWDTQPLFPIAMREKAAQLDGLEKQAAYHASNPSATHHRASFQAFLSSATAATQKNVDWV
jgi:hypothetical protein